MDARGTPGEAGEGAAARGVAAVHSRLRCAQDFDGAERVDRSCDDPSGRLVVWDGVVVGDRLTTRVPDLAHHPFGPLRVVAAAAQVDADVVDHHAAACRGQCERMGRTGAAARTGDDRRAAVQRPRGLLRPLTGHAACVHAPAPAGPGAARLEAVVPT
jgi:hypothetical protein